MYEEMAQQMSWALVAVQVLIAILASAHAVLYKRDVRASIGWVVLIVLVPFLGAAFYAMFGINRIRRAAALARARLRNRNNPPAVAPLEPDAAAALVQRPRLSELAQLTNSISDRALLPGNRVQPLHNGEQAYPEMLAAIEGAQHSISLATYIFEADAGGKPFIDALATAVERGVAVRVLVDAAGARYGWPRIHRVLRKRGIPTAQFMPAGRLRSLFYLNLRLHRKLLVVDGKIGFTGGMNLRHGHLAGAEPTKPVIDHHFRIDGPVVSQLQEVFAEDWEFTTHEPLEGERWFPALAEAGAVVARGIADGPDEDLDKMRWLLAGAIACAEQRIAIMTPYFLPTESLANALNIAALRGVRVDIVLPQRANISLAEWAMVGNLFQVLGHGCHVYRSKGDFEHTKLVVVDRACVLLGSGNWDARSLRLNFEFNLECYDLDLAAKMDDYICSRKRDATVVDAPTLRALPLPIRLRNGLARLLMPYL